MLSRIFMANEGLLSREGLYCGEIRFDADVTSYGEGAVLNYSSFLLIVDYQHQDVPEVYINSKISWRYKQILCFRGKLTKFKHEKQDAVYDLLVTDFISAKPRNEWVCLASEDSKKICQAIKTYDLGVLCEYLGKSDVTLWGFDKSATVFRNTAHVKSKGLWSWGLVKGVVKAGDGIKNM